MEELETLETDPDVGIPFLNEIKDNKIQNIKKILKEIVYKKKLKSGYGALAANFSIKKH